MVVVPVHIALQLPGVHLMRAIGVVGRPFRGDPAILRRLLAQLLPVHENVFELRGDRVFVEVHHKGQLDTVGRPEATGRGMDVEIPGAPFVMVPLDIVGIGIDNIGFANIIISIDPQDDFHIYLGAEVHIEADFSPTQIKFLVKVVHPNERPSQVAMDG